MHYDKNNKIIYDCGDFVTATENCGDAYTKGKAYKVSDTSGERGLLYTALDDKGSTANGWGIRYFRPANQEEINRVEDKIMVGEYEVEFYRKEGCTPHAIKVGCVKVPEELFLKIGKKAGWI